jgi:hypothetical protein
MAKPLRRRQSTQSISMLPQWLPPPPRLKLTQNAATANGSKDF